MAQEHRSTSYPLREKWRNHVNYAPKSLQIDKKITSSWPIASTRLPITNLLDVIGQLNGYLQDVVGRGQPIYRMRLAHSAENISLTRMTRKFVNVPNCFLFSRQRNIYFGITCRKTLGHVVLIKAFSRREIILCVYNGLKSVISWHFTTKFGRNRLKSFKHTKRGDLPRAPTPE